MAERQFFGVIFSVFTRARARLCRFAYLDCRNLSKRKTRLKKRKRRAGSPARREDEHHWRH
ncbi:hypothetical protein ACI00D_001892 [Cronobacter dublinensis]